MTRVVVFIDGSNLLAGINEFYSDKRIKWKAFGNMLADQVGGQLEKIYFFDGQRDQKADHIFWLRQEKIKGDLEKSQIAESRFLPLEYSPDQLKARQRGVDIAIALEMVRQALNNNNRIFVLVSGDADFEEAVIFAKEFGVRTCVASFEKKLGHDLAKAADTTIILDQLPIKKCLH